MRQRKSFNQKERELILKKTNCRCGRCGKKLDTVSMAIDHIYPFAKGGLDDEYNLIALCYDCNQTKSNFIYKATEYYKYMLPAYKDSYEIYQRYMQEVHKKDRIIYFDETEYKFLTPQHVKVLRASYKRGKPLNENKMRKETGATCILRKAYPGENTALYKKIQDAHCGSACYNNEFELLITYN